jgi:adenosine deaminase
MEKELAELHVHLGGAVDPAIMWEIAHAQGIRLPTKDYWHFVEMITANRNSVKGFDDYLELFRLTDLIQSSPAAIETSVYQNIAGAYRKNNITLLELRFNPMKRNRGGEQDLDHIMMAAARGLDRALLEYPVKAGIIVCLDRSFSHRFNEILVEKAIKYSPRGVVGIDIAGPNSKGFNYRDYNGLYKKARKEGLGLTVHAGEEQDHRSVIEVIESLEPERIGHGIRAAEDQRTMDMIKERGITLEICPSSNLSTRVVRDMEHMRGIFDTLNRNKVKYTINTDGPEMLVTNLRNEIEMLLDNGIATESDMARANRLAFKASFLK